MRRIFLFGLVALGIAGCGGGGSSNVQGTVQVSTYATDSFRTDWDHVWVKLYKVTLDGPVPATLFNDPAGRVIDLRTLRDASGEKYTFLDTIPVETAVYSELVATVDKSLSIVPSGGSAAQAKQFSDVNDSVVNPGKTDIRLSILGFTLLTARSMSVDFDLANWSFDGSGKVKALIKQGSNAGISSQLRHVEDNYVGNVSGLTGASPNFNFTIVRSAGSDLKVIASNKTRIYNESGAQSPTLTNTQAVDVTGIYVGGNLIASQIKILDLGGVGGSAFIEGAPSAANEGAGTFRVAVSRATGFEPDAANYTVTTNGGTKFFSDTGRTITKTEFFAGIVGAASVEVDGGAAANGQLTATTAKLHTDDLNQIHIKGSLDSTTNNSFDMSASQWQGVSLHIGDSLTITLSGSTVFVLNGTTVNQATFFAGVPVNSDVNVDALPGSSNMTALKVTN